MELMCIYTLKNSGDWTISSTELSLSVKNDRHHDSRIFSYQKFNGLHLLSNTILSRL